MDIVINELADKIIRKANTKYPHIYRALNEIKIFLEPDFYDSSIKIETFEDHVILRVHTNKYLSEIGRFDLGDQIGYLIECNQQLNLPFTINDAMFKPTIN